MSELKRNFDEECKNRINKYNYYFDDVMKCKIMQNIEELIDISSISNVLEVGCFEGSMTKLLNNKFKSLDVVEPSIECINKINKQFDNVTFINTILQEYTTDKKYDLIIISHTLEHIENQIEALKKAKSLLSDNGYLYVIVPNGTSISRLIACKLNIVDYPCCVTRGEKEHGHYITYDLYTLERHFREANIHNIKLGGIVFKIFGNNQYDNAFKYNIIDNNFIDACYALGKERPMDCASIYCLAKNN
jgi:2-polyprenyl-3-methyl-5-hydroxy-6-metoxy-1,4-benzoquinol methylase